MTSLRRLLTTACIATLLLAAPGAAALGAVGSAEGQATAMAGPAQATAQARAYAEADVELPEVPDLPSYDATGDARAEAQALATSSTTRAQATASGSARSISDADVSDARTSARTTLQGDASAEARADVSGTASGAWSFLAWIKTKVAGSLDAVRGTAANVVASMRVGGDVDVAGQNANVNGDVATKLAADLSNKVPDVPDMPELPHVPDAHLRAAGSATGAASALVR